MTAREALKLFGPGKAKLVFGDPASILAAETVAAFMDLKAIADQAARRNNWREWPEEVNQRLEGLLNSTVSDLKYTAGNGFKNAMRRYL